MERIYNHLCIFLSEIIWVDMWVRLRAEIGRFLYIAICYFALSISMYGAPRREPLFSILNEDIWEFSRDGNIIFLGDFNICMRDH